MNKVARSKIGPVLPPQESPAPISVSPSPNKMPDARSGSSYLQSIMALGGRRRIVRTKKAKRWALVEPQLSKWSL